MSQYRIIVNRWGNYEPQERVCWCFWTRIGGVHATLSEAEAYLLPIIDLRRQRRSGIQVIKTYD